jgi:hypothetical protein
MADHADFFERHYTVTELAQLWHMSPGTVRAWFLDAEGVIKYGAARLNKARRRTHVSLRIPESVARRIYLERTGRAVLPSGRELVR